MILKLLFYVFKGVLDLVDLLLPNWEPINLDSAVDTIQTQQNVFSLLAWANYYMPLTDLLLGITVVLAVYPGALIYKGVMKLLRTLHIIGG